MANFAVIIDVDADRRAEYLVRAQRHIAPVDHLAISCLSKGVFGAVWAVGAGTPVRSFVNGERSAVILGDAIEADSAARVAAADLSQRWDPANHRIPDPFDGYYAAVAASGRGLTAGADLLGMFPLYYAATKDAVIISSTPELISLHPLFPVRISVAGLVGILLTDALVDNCPLLEGVRRLQPGHAVVWQSGRGAREVLQYAMPVSERQSTLSYREQIDQLDYMLDQAIQRHTPQTDPHGILLSGGRDSRMLAGYHQQQARRPRALTMGVAGDYEVICAARVARSLRLDHRIATTAVSDYTRAAILHATWDHLSSGFSSVHLWGMTDHLRALAPTFTTGYLTDVIAGGSGIKLRSMPGRVMPWEIFFAKVNARGIAVETLKRMLQVRGAAELVDSVVARIKANHENSSPLPGERNWRFQLASTGRHRVGSIPWRLSFGSWPVVPILDRRVLNAAATLPADTMANRGAQDEILRRRFPDLARISLVVQNAEIERPLVASLARRAGHRVWGKLNELKLVARPRAHTSDRRYNWRMYDFNGPGWQAIRGRAEPNRARLATLFDPYMLEDYLPAPHAVVPTRNFSDTMGRKQLVGLMLWAEAHLS